MAGGSGVRLEGPKAFQSSTTVTMMRRSKINRPMVAILATGTSIKPMMDEKPVAPPEPDPALRRRSRMAMLKYGAARLALFLGLTVVIQALVMIIGAPVPLLMSALLALFVALPLSMLVFTKLRVDAVQSLAAYSAQRKAHKEWVQQQLAGR